MQYGNESQKPPYKDESEESPADKKQHLIEENMMEDLLYDFNNLDTIVLRPAAVNIYYIRKAKRGLRYSKQIIRLMTKAMEVTEASAVYTVIRML